MQIIIQILITVIKLLNSRLFQLLLLLGGLANFIITRYNLNIDKIHYMNMSTSTTPKNDTNTKSEPIKINWWNSLKIIIKYTIFTNLIIGAGLMLWAFIETAFDYYGIYIFSIKYYLKNILEYYHNIYYSFLSNLAAKLNSYSEWIKSLGSGPNVDTLNTVDNKEIINTVGPNEQEIINKIDLEDNKLAQVPNNQLDIEEQESLRKTYKTDFIQRNSNYILLALGIGIGILSAYLLIKYGILPKGSDGSAPGNDPMSPIDITLTSPSDAPQPGPTPNPSILRNPVSKEDYNTYFRSPDISSSGSGKGTLPRIDIQSLPNDPSSWATKGESSSTKYLDPFQKASEPSSSPTSYLGLYKSSWNNPDVYKSWEASNWTKFKPTAESISPTSSVGSLTPKASTWTIRDFPNIPR